LDAEQSQDDQTNEEDERDELPKSFVMASAVLLLLPSVIALLMIFLMESWSGILVMVGTAVLLLAVNGALLLFLSKRLRGG